MVLRAGLDRPRLFPPAAFPKALPAPLALLVVQVRRLFVTDYRPNPGLDALGTRAQTAANARARVAVAVLTAADPLLTS